MKVTFFLLAAGILGQLIAWTPHTFFQGVIAGLGFIFLLQLVVLVLILP